MKKSNQRLASSGVTGKKQGRSVEPINPIEKSISEFKELVNVSNITKQNVELKSETLPIGLKPVENLEIDKNEISEVKKHGVYFVIFISSMPKGSGFEIVKPVMLWVHAQTKAHARNLARSLQAGGATIVDIVQGNTTDIFKKFQGLK